MALPKGRSVLKQRKPLEEAEMDITPMIDCTFLLLIFFLVTSRMTAEASLDLPKAQHGKSVVEKDSVMLTVLKGNGDLVQIYKGKGQSPANLIEASSIAEQEEEVARYVEEEATASGKRYVLIKAERGIKHRDVARVQRAAGRAEVEQLYVAVLETQ
jgi:biopolymer transport protein ExbD